MRFETDSEGRTASRCVTSIHPGTERHGRRCVLAEGHDGDHEAVESPLALRIDPDGMVTALSGSGIEEAIDLRAFGRMTTERAGRIEFDAVSQTWGWEPVGEVGAFVNGFGFRTRREAVADEVATLAALL